MMEQDFLSYLQKEGYFKDHRRVLLALSGGLDSMTLLSLLYRYQKELDIDLVLAHVNHQQRPESAEEEVILTQYAQQLGLPIFTAYFEGDFTEEKGRKFRYEFFAHLMKEKACTALVTAHHANDQAETIFMRLLRGSRLRFLTGIAVRQSFATGELIRPLLPFKKSDFKDIFHLEDDSNKSEDYLRNRIRNHYLPLLESENPQLQSALGQLSQQVSDWKVALEDLTRGIETTCLVDFQAQSQAVQSFLFESYLAGFPDLQVTRQQFDQLLHILQSKANYRAPLKSGYEFVKDYERFVIQKISPKSHSQVSQVLLEYGNNLEINGYHLSFGVALSGQQVTVMEVSRETPLVIRGRKSGDSLLYRGHHKKLRRLFIDQKIAQDLREQAIVIEQEGKILGIAGLVTSDLSQDPKHDIMKSKLYIQKLDR